MSSAEGTPLLDDGKGNIRSWRHTHRAAVLLFVATVACTSIIGMRLVHNGEATLSQEESAVTVEPMFIWTAADKSYVQMACNWLRSVAVHIGETETQRSVYLFVDSPETQARMEKCGPPANYIMPDRVQQAWAQSPAPSTAADEAPMEDEAPMDAGVQQAPDEAPVDAGAEQAPVDAGAEQAPVAAATGKAKKEAPADMLSAGAILSDASADASLGSKTNLLKKDKPGASLGADLNTGGAAFNEAVARKVLQTKAAVQIAKEKGFRYVIFNDGDTAWTRDFREVMPDPENLLVAGQNDVGTPEGYAIDVQRPNGDTNVNEGQVICTGILVFNVQNPLIEKFVDDWKQETDDIVANNGDLPDQTSFNNICTNKEEYHCGMLNARYAASGWLLIQGDWNEFHEQIHIGHADYIGDNEGKVAFLKRWGMWYIRPGEEL